MASWMGDHTRMRILLPVILPALFTLTACNISSGGGSGDDPDPPPALPSLSIADTSIVEGDAGIVPDAFFVSLSDQSAQTVTVDYRSIDGTARAGIDYEAASGTLTFNPGQISAQIPVNVIGNVDDDGDRTFTMELTAPVNATIADGVATGTIVDDDGGALFGLDTRPVNATCLAPPRAIGGTQVTLTSPYPNLASLSQPTKLLQAPADNGRWFVLEKAGRIRVFDNLPGVTSHELWLDISAQVNANSEGGLLGMAFHPDWPAVKEVYLSYTGNPGGPMVSVVSRFIVDDDSSLPVAVTEQPILSVDQDFDNHDGGDIAFGPDRYLYFGLGDGGSGGDPNERAQDTTRLLGSFLRVGVLGVAWPAPGYTIPPDNPFAGNPRCGPGGNAQDCPEIYAWGFRNPWRWSFDTVTDALWAADVGQNQWEEVDVVELGGNYGWDCREGAHDYEPGNCPGGGLVEPVAEYDHSLGNSITGGFVYRGGNVPVLEGRYVFGDFGSGRLWALRDDGQGRLEPEELLDTNFNISAFGEDAAGELYFLHYGGGEILRIDAAGGPVPDAVPDNLVDTGCANPADPTEPASGLIPYGMNAPFWSDGAAKTRWLALPDADTITIQADDDWDFPAGSVLRKDFRLGGQLIETRLMMHHPDGVWAGYTYEWNDAETQATRVRGGKVRDVNGQSWIYPSESQCMECHTAAAGFALGPETGQLNGDLTYPSTGRTANQLATLEHIGVFSAPLPAPPDALPKMADPADPGAPLDDRARAYLHTNCSQCHRPGGPTPSSMDLRVDTALADTNACDVPPHHGFIGIPGGFLIDPGDASRSIVIARMDRRDIHGMPPIGSALVDVDGVALSSSWIDSLSGCN